ncbi:hypothetical protein DFJ67_7201 [Asanoa ferruginea]|uniref:Bulb-type lectin domain-containing protein n=1 Tax=Asanoa ferruginea TaxID=53367 RepID=A0A3D9ZYA3_9ACTN|nr:hypothetical protein [Asanoa ferruginea]REG01124.1 hypothetical protein DFJ67_7201 [Asanoa ferruginea]GIF47174.1 hypothetical protein Afe04nite_17130 [Asanoa ferruginea]
MPHANPPSVQASGHAPSARRFTRGGIRRGLRLRVAAATAIAVVASMAGVASPAAASVAYYTPSCMFNVYDTAIELTTAFGVKAWFVRQGSLWSGEVCQIGLARLEMQPDGNLVLYDERRVARWAMSWRSSRVFNNAAHYGFQGFDGNLVAYDDWGWPVAATDTCCFADAILAVQEDGNLIIYQQAPTGKLTPRWATNSSH